MESPSTDKTASWAQPRRSLPQVALRTLFKLLGAVSPPLAARLAHYLWFHPQRYAPPAREHGVLREASCHPIMHAGKQISVYSWGTGPTVLLVHGWSGRGTQMGEFVAPLVAAGYRVVAFDAPAHGRSAGHDTNLPEISDVILTLARQYGPMHAVVTHSFGGPCALYALRQQQFAKRMIAISPPVTVQMLMDSFSSALALTPATVTLLCNRMERRFGADMWERFSTLSMATQVTLPAMVIHDRDDRDVPWRDGEAVARAWRADFMRTQGLGHRRILRDVEVIERVVRFVDTANDFAEPVNNAESVLAR